ncbi:hypothetical protein BN961_00528 [Afipia felis]|uniref:Uncharacterized protein n=1 Tax=Afipia felis TaxID=1035 RepID=A0A090MLF2_AFIFE|nr:hypothetical protein BN961_00528 [Afipia felis]
MHGDNLARRGRFDNRNRGCVNGFVGARSRGQPLQQHDERGFRLRACAMNDRAAEWRLDCGALLGKMRRERDPGKLTNGVVMRAGCGVGGFEMPVHEGHGGPF